MYVMWFLGGFWRVIKGFWRLLVGLVIGAILYVWMFFNFKDFWELTHRQVTYFMDWVVTQPMAADYSQWNTLLNMDDKLTFALYVMAGRIIWLLFESIVFSFPMWLLFGRQKNGAGSTPLGQNAAVVAAVPAAQNLAPTMAPAEGHQAAAPVSNGPPPQGTGLEVAIEKVVDTGVAPVGNKVALGLEELDENAGDLERSIDEALERIKHVGGQPTNS